MPYSTNPVPNPLTYHSQSNDYGVPLGRKFTYQHELWGEWTIKFVRSTALSAAAVTAGMVAIKVAVNGATVTADVTAGDGATGLPAAGVFLAGTTADPILPGDYHFVLTDGYYPAVLTAGAAVASGDLVIVNSATDGKTGVSLLATAVTSTLISQTLGTARAAAVVGPPTSVAVEVGVPYAL